MDQEQITATLAALTDEEQRDLTRSATFAAVLEDLGPGREVPAVEPAELAPVLRGATQFVEGLEDVRRAANHLTSDLDRAIDRLSPMCSEDTVQAKALRASFTFATLAMWDEPVEARMFRDTLVVAKDSLALLTSLMPVPVSPMSAGDAVDQILRDQVPRSQAAELLGIRGADPVGALDRRRGRRHRSWWLRRD